MAQSILIFDFGTNEEAAQQARLKVEAWTQGFRLGKKIVLKFDREGPAAKEKETAEETESAKGATKAGKKSGEGQGETSSARVRLLLKLDFSDHEKLTGQRWLDRIPAEEPFKSAKDEIIRHGAPGFAEATKRFDSLD